jgi:putative tributyrin esterase
MAFFQCQFFSDALQIQASMNVILPEPAVKDIPVLYLLHGLSDDHTAWTRQSSIERYAQAKGIAVVMPAVNRSFYADTDYGAKYWTFISEEVPRVARSFFPLSAKREDNFAAGLSMGGYGAFKLGLTYPERYAAVASLSGALDLERLVQEDFAPDMYGIFSDKNAFRGSSADLFALAEKAAGQPSLPMLYQCCGTEDFLYEDNTRFRDHCLSLGLPLHYNEGPGLHEWGYWDLNIARIIDWLPIQEKR